MHIQSNKIPSRKRRTLTQRANQTTRQPNLHTKSTRHNRDQTNDRPASISLLWTRNENDVFQHRIILGSADKEITETILAVATGMTPDCCNSAILDVELTIPSAANAMRWALEHASDLVELRAALREAGICLHQITLLTTEGRASRPLHVFE
ncbi:MAG: hypothetical protein AAGG69_00765 [Pseudomonadota bacterium]